MAWHIQAPAWCQGGGEVVVVEMVLRWSCRNTKYNEMVHLDSGLDSKRFCKSRSKGDQGVWGPMQVFLSHMDYGCPIRLCLSDWESATLSLNHVFGHSSYILIFQRAKSSHEFNLPPFPVSLSTSQTRGPFPTSSTS
jgi:hypothetical protein